MEQHSKKRKIKCEVVSDKMQKSCVGKIIHLVKHPVVGKYVKRTSKIMFHDELNEAKIGDQVLIEECSPKSANKAFKLVSIVKKV